MVLCIIENILFIGQHCNNIGTLNMDNYKIGLCIKRTNNYICVNRYLHILFHVKIESTLKHIIRFQMMLCYVTVEMYFTC